MLPTCPIRSTFGPAAGAAVAVGAVVGARVGVGEGAVVGWGAGALVDVAAGAVVGGTGVAAGALVGGAGVAAGAQPLVTSMNKTTTTLIVESTFFISPPVSALPVLSNQANQVGTDTAVVSNCLTLCVSQLASMLVESRRALTITI